MPSLLSPRTEEGKGNSRIPRDRWIRPIDSRTDCFAVPGRVLVPSSLFFLFPPSLVYSKKRSFIYSTTDVKKDKHKMHIVFFLSFFFFWNQEIVHQRMPDQGCLVSGALIHVVMYTLYLSLPSSSSSILHRTAMKTVSLVRAPQRESCRGQFGGGKKNRPVDIDLAFAYNKLPSLSLAPLIGIACLFATGVCTYRCNAKTSRR